MWDGDSLGGLSLPGSVSLRFTVAEVARPDVKASVGEKRNFPCAPDAFTFTETAIGNVVPAEVGLGPITLAAGSVVVTANREAPDVVIAVAGDFAAGES